MTRRIRTLSLLAGALTLWAGAAQAQVTTRVSVSSTGVQGNGDSPYAGAKISGNGQFVAFRSVATNLVAADTNAAADIFVRDRLAGTTERVSLAWNGAQAAGVSNNPSISHDGRYVAFSSTAALVPEDTNGVSDIYVRDRLVGATTLVSVDASGTGAAGNGQSDSSAIAVDSGGQVVVAFRTLATNLTGAPTSGSQVVVRNLSTGLTSLVSVAPDGVTPGNGESGLVQVAISADANVVGFSSLASNLVAADANGSVRDVFVRNLSVGTTTLVSQSSGGLQGLSTSYGSALSADGRYVAFASRNNFVNGDSNNVEDVFVRDTVSGSTVRVSVDSAGKQGNGASGYTEGWGIAISANGMRVAFPSKASNLVKGDTNGFEDVFLRDIATGKTTLVSVSATNGPANGSSGGLSTGSVSLSADGLTVMFCSVASNLVSGDTNGFMDVFVRTPLP